MGSLFLFRLSKRGRAEWIGHENVELFFSEFIAFYPRAGSAKYSVAAHVIIVIEGLRIPGPGNCIKSIPSHMPIALLLFKASIGLI